MRIGIDVGGTNIEAGLVDENYKVIAKLKTPTLPERGALAIMNDIVNLTQKLTAGRSTVTSIGIGLPGLVDSEKGVVIQCINIPFQNTPLTQELRRVWDIPIYLSNDSNAAAWGEYLAGVGRGYRDMVMLTLGTGIGSGVILDGKIFTGKNGAAGELGHILISHDGLPCSCGRRGCWETYASATGLIRLTKEVMKKTPDSLMWQEVSGNLDCVGGRTAFLSSLSHDPAAQFVLRQFVEYLSAGILSVLNIFQPELICLGGGIGNEGERLLEPIRNNMERYTFFKDVRQTKLCSSALGGEAGVIGAALLGVEA